MPSNVSVVLAALLLISACTQLPNKSDESTARNTPTVLAEPLVLRKAPVPLPQVEPLPRIVIDDEPAPVGKAARPEVQPPAMVKVDLEPAALPVTMWERIRRGFALPALNNRFVRQWENWYTKRPDYVARMIERSSRYLYYVMEEVERRHMPAEIALLPMIESAYNPHAYSKAHASGIWQFIPSTGKTYGLRQNWWYDGRRDIIAATNAALDYLEKLYGMFGSWDLALASYNWGEGAVGRAIARNQAKGFPTDYKSLTMPAETREYVPKLIAVKNIISDPGRYGLQLANLLNEPYFATMPVERHIDVKLAAQFAQMPLDEFKSLNPANNKPVIKSGAAETIVLPKDKVDVFLANLNAHDEPLVSWQVHTVKAGEHPAGIAAHYGMTLTELKHLNGLPYRKKIATGQPLLVPVRGNAEPDLPDLPAAPVSLPKALNAARYAQHQTTRGRVASGTLQKVKLGKRGGVKAIRVAQLPAAAKRVKVVLRPKHTPAPGKAVLRTGAKLGATHTQVPKNLLVAQTPRSPANR